MTLTLKLIQDIIKVHPSTKVKVPMSNGSVGGALTDTKMHTQTGGNEKLHAECPCIYHGKEFFSYFKTQLPVTLLRL